MTIIRALEGYDTSKDYKRLWHLAQQRGIVCIVDYDTGERTLRDIASTNSLEGNVNVGCRGVCWVLGDTYDDFLEQCDRCNLEWIAPHDLRTAPWPDWGGNLICEGDIIEHPSGERGTVFFLEDKDYDVPADQWRVNYGGKTQYSNFDGYSRLCLQLGDRGRAQVVQMHAVSSPKGEQQKSGRSPNLKE